MVGKKNIEVKIRKYRLALKFIVCDTRDTARILSADSCDNFVIAIRTQDRKVELTDRTSVPIVRDPAAVYPGDRPDPTKDPPGET